MLQPDPERTKYDRAESSGRWFVICREHHGPPAIGEGSTRIVDIPPELPKPLEVLPKSPPPVVFVLPKAGVAAEPKPIPREDGGK